MEKSKGKAELEQGPYPLVLVIVLYQHPKAAFSFCVGVWISPEVTGSRPPPCGAFSFTRVDSCRVALFGGRQREERTDQLHILNMDTWVSGQKSVSCMVKCLVAML